MVWHDSIDRGDVASAWCDCLGRGHVLCAHGVTARGGPAIGTAGQVAVAEGGAGSVLSVGLDCRCRHSWKRLLDLAGTVGRARGLYVHLMQGLGIVMITLFCFIYFVPYRRLGQALQSGAIPAAGVQMALIRRIIGINLVIGLVTSAIGVSRWV